MEETILDTKNCPFLVTIRATGRPATLALQYIGHAVRHAIFPPYVCVVLFVFFLYFFCFGALVYGRHACVAMPVALQYARLAGAKLYAVVKCE